jgi:hypothetical protein
MTRCYTTLTDVTFLGLPVEQVFPIRYDLSAFAVGEPSVLCGEIQREPPSRLSRPEVIALAVSRAHEPAQG